MTFISYAQNFEDVMLWRSLKHVESGFYIDVGACDPREFSITKAFYDQGWQGINIEPVSEWFEKLSKDRARDINLQLAAGAQQGEMTLYEISETGLSTLVKTIAERHESERGYRKTERKVSIKTITELCEENQVAEIHFLKIDVEGAEKQVLEGIDFSKVRPWIMLIEATLPSTQTQDHQDWEPILLSNDYEFVYFDGLNRFYVAREHSEIKASFGAPPNVFDEFVRSSEIEANAKAEQAEAKVEQAEAKAEQAEALCHDLYNSTSWRITYPLRELSKFIHWFIPRSVAWLTFAPGSRPRRVLKKTLLKFINYVRSKPRLQRKLTQGLNCFPKFKIRLKQVNSSISYYSCEQTLPHSLDQLTTRAGAIYMQLKTARAVREDQCE